MEAMKLLSAAVGKTNGNKPCYALGIVFLIPNPGAEDLYDSRGFRLTVYEPTDMMCAAGRTLARVATVAELARALDEWATEHAPEPVSQGIGFTGDRLQIVDYEDGSLICSMKFSSFDYVPNINMEQARPKEQA